MNDFNKILDKAKELELKMKESQENIKKLRVEGVSGSNSVKVVLDGVNRQFDGMWGSSLTDSTAKGKPDIELIVSLSSS